MQCLLWKGISKGFQRALYFKYGPGELEFCSNKHGNLHLDSPIPCWSQLKMVKNRVVAGGSQRSPRVSHTNPPASHPIPSQAVATTAPLAPTFLHSGNDRNASPGGRRWSHPPNLQTPRWRPPSVRSFSGWFHGDEKRPASDWKMMG
jgi:hypothetical protein